MAAIGVSVAPCMFPVRLDLNMQTVGHKRIRRWMSCHCPLPDNEREKASASDS
ncbi:hypothetical protein KCP69_18445 [Salmonella enterica subsp. enterica]|nr:hypothetical protein KCP69_18445 [Salmonella enterica subsp. enterica]